MPDSLTPRVLTFTFQSAAQELAEANVPVLCTVHQPSSEIFAKFDDARSSVGS